jgi:large subunit ribosomal protein L9
MEIILKQDVQNVGLKDDILKVKNGYANNYLIPKGYAITATTSAVKELKERRKQQSHKEARSRNEALELAEKIKNKKFTIGAKTSATGKIFGSVNTIQLAEAFAKKGFEIDRKQFIMNSEHIKEVGTYTATIKLFKEVKVEFEFEVVSE